MSNKKKLITKRPMSERLPALMIGTHQKESLIAYANDKGESLSSVVRTAVDFFLHSNYSKSTPCSRNVTGDENAN